MSERISTTTRETVEIMKISINAVAKGLLTKTEEFVTRCRCALVEEMVGDREKVQKSISELFGVVDDLSAAVAVERSAVPRAAARWEVGGTTSFPRCSPEVGMRVLLRGLSSFELNGKVGVIVSLNDQRSGVLLEQGKKV